MRSQFLLSSAGRQYEPASPNEVAEKFAQQAFLATVPRSAPRTTSDSEPASD